MDLTGVANSSTHHHSPSKFLTCTGPVVPERNFIIDLKAVGWANQAIQAGSCRKRLAAWPLAIREDGCLRLIKAQAIESKCQSFIWI